MTRKNWALYMFFLLPVVGLVSFILWWRLYGERWQEGATTSRVEPISLGPIRPQGPPPWAKPKPRPPAPTVEPVAEPEPTPSEPDDLKRISGIGPKISAVLGQAGILTFAQLAAADFSRLEGILAEAGVRAAPATWPEQAALAAAGDWDGLKRLQAELKGGRRLA